MVRFEMSYLDPHKVVHTKFDINNITNVDKKWFKIINGINQFDRNIENIILIKFENRYPTDLSTYRIF